MQKLDSPTTAFNTQQSQKLSQEITQVIPGGVDSPFRSFHEVGGHTIFFKHAQGAHLTDVDGNTYIDYLGAWGPAILGHCAPSVVSACQQALAAGPVHGSPHELELALARALTNLIPSLEKVRFVSSGTEAVMSAIRLARGYTKRDLLIMFEGCYHGHSDVVLASRNHKASAGVPDAVAHNTLVVPFNDLSALQDCLKQYGKQTAAVVIEPVAGSMGVVPPKPGYLEGVRKLCTQFGALLIFDEVLTGLRVALGGAQVLYGITPDLTCFGKALGGGMPIGAYGGRAEIMDALLPNGDVYQAGTFSGNPLTMAGGLETLRLLADGKPYAVLEDRTAQLFAGVKEACDGYRIPLQLQRVGSMFAFVFAAYPVTNYQESLSIDAQLFARFFHKLLAQGIYLPPSAVDASCVSAAHSQQDIEQTVSICRQALSELA